MYFVFDIPMNNLLMASQSYTLSNLEIMHSDTVRLHCLVKKLKEHREFTRVVSSAYSNESNLQDAKCIYFT